jgi:uncharacterized protein (TIGR03435 family)
MRALLVLLTNALLLVSQTVVNFDAASVKPTPPDHPAFTYRFGPESVSLRGSLLQLIETAYDVRHYQVTGGPAWSASDWYDVEARAAGETDTGKLRRMVQALLADRFQLKVHRESRPTSGYVLVVDKGGPKLPTRKDVPPGSEGVIQVGGGIWSRGAPISQLAYGLTLQLGQPVIDETGIEGNYDFRLRFDDGEDVIGKASTEPKFGSPFTAVHEIGLRLEAKKMPIDTIVIDSASRPSGN